MARRINVAEVRNIGIMHSEMHTGGGEGKK